MSKLTELIKHYTSLDDDRAEEAAIVDAITRNIHFRGANLWTLIFAVIIASVGLNVNSTAVIIGAMLISPLMGPIMGVGLGIGINDFDVVRKGIKNLLVAVIFSIATSALYFYITPLHTANSELLARTTPTIWDVFIAFAGGLAGIIGATRREKSNIIPGVAIATALMPPLCTAGFGLATGHYYYFLGALYLFFINSVFICIATVLIVSFMKFHKREFQDERRKKRMTRYIILVVTITVAPSIWLAYGIVQKAVFESAATNYVDKEFSFSGTQVVSRHYDYNRHHSKIELLLIGQVLDSLTIDSLQRKLPAYHLDSTRLVIRQGLNAQKQFDIAQVKASILDEVFRNDTAATIVPPAAVPKKELPDLRADLKGLFPQVQSYTLSKAAVIHTDSVTRKDSILLFVATGKVPLSNTDQQRLKQWLTAKFSPDSLLVFYRH